MKKNILFWGSSSLLAMLLSLAVSLQAQGLCWAEGQNMPAEGLRMEDAIINLANIAGKSVVSISSEHVAKIKGSRRQYYRSPLGESPFGDSDTMRRFFDDFFGGLPDREYKQTGLGSGVIIDAQGYILTNQHVIDEADKITVTLSDGREFKAEIKGQDARSDLAVIKINARDLPVALLGESDNLKIGQWVVAIGNPFGFALQNAEPTVTAGVISALHRSLGRTLLGDRDYGDLIQTDAAINPGNSGGPLVNLKGEVIGINMAIFTTTGGYQGVGFAIPINNAKRIIKRLIEGKKIIYGWLGVTVQDLNEGIAKYFGLTDKKGALVAKVSEKGPAQKAGIKERDIIRGFDNKTINNVSELLSAVGKTEAGKKVKINLIRDKKPLVLEVEVDERPQELDKDSQGQEEKAAQNWRGLEAGDLNSEFSQRLKIDEKKGVVVVDVQTGSPADEAGIIAGDVILEINKIPIDNLADYSRVTKNLKGDCLLRTARGYFLIKSGE